MKCIYVLLAILTAQVVVVAGAALVRRCMKASRRSAYDENELMIKEASV